MQWPEYQVPSLAGQRQENKMRYDGMRGLGSLGDAAALAAAKKIAADAKAANAARTSSGLPSLPASVIADLIARGISAATALIQVPRDAAGDFRKNANGTFVVETITQGGGTTPGFDIPSGGGGGGGSVGGVPVIALVAVGGAVAVAAVVMMMRRK